MPIESGFGSLSVGLPEPDTTTIVTGSSGLPVEPEVPAPPVEPNVPQPPEPEAAMA